MTTLVVELYEALKKAGVEEDLARSAARAVISAGEKEQLVTKADLRAELAELRTELHTDIANVRTEIERMGRVIIMWMVGIALGALATMTGILIALIRAFAP
jgi:enoyl-CoA hydratase/carnithine racemase